MTEPRLVTRQALCTHLGSLCRCEVKRLIANQRLAKPLWKQDTANKSARQDWKAVGQALDAALMIVMTVEEGTALMDRAMGFRS